MPSPYRAIGYSALSWLFLTHGSLVQPMPVVTGPTKANECGVPALYHNTNPILIKTILFGFCDVYNTADQSTIDKLKSIKAAVEGLSDISGWNTNKDIDPVFVYAVPEGETCTLPISGGEVSPTIVWKVITFSYIFAPQVATNAIDATASAFATKVQSSLLQSNAVSTFTTCIGINSVLCNAIKSKLSDGRYGFSLTDSHIAQDVASSLGCAPRYAGAIPRFSDNIDGGDSLCSCVCPAGKEFSHHAVGDPNRICKDVTEPMDNANCDECKKFTTDTLTQPTDTKCTISGVGDEFIVPSPWDNYVFDQINQAPATIFAKWENVDHENSKKDETFEWTDFNTTNAQWKSFLTFPAVGRYRLTVNASDYSASTVCQTVIMIEDNVAPTSKYCTASQYQPVSDNDQAPVFSLDNLNSAIASLKSVRKFVTKADRGGHCGSMIQCNAYRTSTKNLDPSVSRADGSLDSLPSENEIKKFFVLNTDDLAALKLISTTITTINPGRPILKCRGLGARLGEMRVPYSCPTDLTSDLGLVAPGKCEIPEGWTTSLDNRACESYECLNVKGNSFYTASISLTHACKQKTHSVTDQLKQASNDNPDATIERIAPGKVLGEDQVGGSVVLNLTESIDILLGFTELAKNDMVKYDAKEIDDKTTIKDILKCRYKINTQSKFTLWNSALGAENTATFSQAKSTIYIECYTTIGLIQKKEINVIVYPTADFDISTQFSERAWTQGGSTDGPFTSYPNSDFAELTFTLPKGFEADVLTSAGDYKFQKIVCLAKFVALLADGVKHEALTNDCTMLEYEVTEGKDPKDITKHFSIGLVNDPKTEGITTLDLSCTLTFKHADHVILSAQEISTIVPFSDQEKPLFPLKEVGVLDVSDCAGEKKCIDKIKPFGYCGGNYITYVPNKNELGESIMGIGKVDFQEGDSTQACCTDCGDYVCSKLYDDDETLKQCIFPVVTSTATAALLQNGDMVDHGIISSSNLFSLSGAMMISVFAAIGMVVGKFIALKTNQKNDTDNTGYAPLL